LARTV